MTDGVIKGTGNSRLLKSVSNFLALYPTYTDFVSALVAGTLPVDFNGINSAGWTTLATALNKANLLSDETAAALVTALGGATPATVNEAFSKLAVKPVKVTTGSYTGTGTYGESNPKSLSFSNSLYLLFISPATSNIVNNPTVLIRNAKFSVTDGSMSNWGVIVQSWSDKSVSWYNTSTATRQLNESGVTYKYAAVTI